MEGEWSASLSFAIPPAGACNAKPSVIGRGPRGGDLIFDPGGALAFRVEPRPPSAFELDVRLSVGPDFLLSSGGRAPAGTLSVVIPPGAAGVDVELREKVHYFRFSENMPAVVDAVFVGPADSGATLEENDWPIPAVRSNRLVPSTVQFAHDGNGMSLAELRNWSPVTILVDPALPPQAGDLVRGSRIRITYLTAPPQSVACNRLGLRLPGGRPFDPDGWLRIPAGVTGVRFEVRLGHVDDVPRGCEPAASARLYIKEREAEGRLLALGTDKTLHVSPDGGIPVPSIGSWGAVILGLLLRRGRVAAPPRPRSRGTVVSAAAPKLAALAVAVLTSLVVPGIGSGQDGTAIDRKALESLYVALDGPAWSEHGGWGTAAPLSEWDGVELDADGRVTAVDIHGRSAYGELPRRLVGLDRLVHLGLAQNYVHGTLPPGSAGSPGFPPLMWTATCSTGSCGRASVAYRPCASCTSAGTGSRGRSRPRSAGIRRLSSPRPAGSRRARWPVSRSACPCSQRSSSSGRSGGSGAGRARGRCGRCCSSTSPADRRCAPDAPLRRPRVRRRRVGGGRGEPVHASGGPLSGRLPRAQGRGGGVRVRHARVDGLHSPRPAVRAGRWAEGGSGVMPDFAKGIGPVVRVRIAFLAVLVGVQLVVLAGALALGWWAFDAVRQAREAVDAGVARVADAAEGAVDAVQAAAGRAREEVVRAGQALAEAFWRFVEWLDARGVPLVEWLGEIRRLLDQFTGGLPASPGPGPE